MEPVAIDLASRQSQVCVRQADGRIVEEKRVETSRLKQVLSQRPPSIVVLETATGAFQIADMARSLGHTVRVVPATLVRALGVGHRGIKTDERDARALSEASCRMELPSVHIPSEPSREIKSLNTSRETLINARTKLIHSVRGYLRGRPLGTLRATPKTLPNKVRQKMESSADGLPRHIEALLVSVETLNVQIAALDLELSSIVEQDARMKRLCTVPGVGPVTASRFVAALDETSRFGAASSVSSYFGLTAGEHSSGDRTRRTLITKAGNASVRWVRIQAAWCLYRRRPEDPIVGWAPRIAERRGKIIAIVALARTLCGVLYAMWRDGTDYNNTRGAVT